MISTKSLIRNFISLNDDEMWVFLSKFSLLLRGPLLSLSIVFFLNATGQGLWFTFMSLSMITIAVELGFTTLITQLLSHEFNSLIDKDGFIYGKKQFRDKFFSLIKYSIKIYLFMVPFACILSIVVGLYVFSEENESTKLAWVLFSFISCFSLIISLFQSIYMGIDKVAFTYRLRTIYGLIFTCSAIFFMSLGFVLWSLIFSSLIANILLILMLYKECPRFWNQLFRHKFNTKFNWKEKVLKLQGKYAVSWMSAYGSAYLFIPFIYSFYGAELAGQFGLSISLIAGISNLSLSWVDSVIPKLNILVAQKARKEMNNLFFTSAIKGYFLFFIGSSILILLVYFMNLYEFYAARILSFDLTFLFLISELGIFSFAVIGKYLRTHKDEPLYLLSVVNSITIIVILFFILPYFKIKGLIISMIILTYMIILPFSLLIARNFLNKYYKEIKK